jgi:hypothetical protein
MWRHLAAEVGVSKITGGGDWGCTKSLIGCGASGAYALGPDDEEEEEDMFILRMFTLKSFNLNPYAANVENMVSS